MRFAIACVLILANIAFGESVDERRTHRETPVVRAVRSASPSVVNISTTRIVEHRPGWLDEDIFNFFNLRPPSTRERMHSLGSGFVLHPSGYIVTNAHVVELARTAEDISIGFVDNTTLKAQAAYLDRESDLAVVKVDVNKPLKALKLARGDDLMIGETVIAIGNPLGYHHTITVGVISAVDRTLEFQRGQVYRRLIQTDASINPGNSGGPLLNINGELIGINTAIRGDAQNIGFAINVETLKRLLGKLLDVELIRRIDLGFMTAPIADGQRLRIASVQSSSPADKSGLLAGDQIVAFDEKQLTDPVEFYIAMLERPAGTSLPLTVDRNGKQVNVVLPFNVKPKPDGKKLAEQRLGLVVDESAKLGIVVKRVVPDSPAGAIGVRRGDMLVKLAGRRIESLDALGELLERLRPAEMVSIGIRRRQGNALYESETYIKIR